MPVAEKHDTDIKSEYLVLFFTPSQRKKRKKKKRKKKKEKKNPQKRKTPCSHTEHLSDPSTGV